MIANHFLCWWWNRFLSNVWIHLWSLSLLFLTANLIKHQWTGAVLLSTSGCVQIQSYYEQARYFKTDFRTNFDLSLFQLLQNNFFGIGNDSKLDETLRDSESYFYESRSFAFLFKGRYPIHKVPGEINRFDELIIANTFYEYSLNNTGTAQISVENPQGFGKSYLRTLGTGFF